MASRPHYPIKSIQELRKQEDDASRHLAALAFGLMVLLASPGFTMDRPGGKGLKPLSPIECGALSMLQVLPPLKPFTQVLMYPATISQRMSVLLRHCYLGHKDQCRASYLAEFGAIWQEADLSPLLEDVTTLFAPQFVQFMLAGGLIVTFGGLVGMIRPVKLTVIGQFMMVYSAYMTPGIEVLPTLIMHSLLLGYSIFHNMFGKFDAPVAPTPRTAPAAGGPSTPGSSKKAGKAGGKTPGRTPGSDSKNRKKA